MKKPRRKRCKAKTYNIILSLYIVVMILANANLVYGISDIHQDRVKEAELIKTASLNSLTTTFITSASKSFSIDKMGFIEKAISYFEEHIYRGPILTKGRGTIQGPSGKETYYNLNMSGVVSIMRRMGYDYEYWVRDDGVKMFGNDVMVAANLTLRPRGSLVQTSLGMGIVCDTGGFAKRNPTQIDIATTW